MGGRRLASSSGQPCLAGQRVEAADGPGVAAVERLHELHHVVVGRDVVAAALQVDGGPDEHGAADGDQARLDERHRQAWSCERRALLSAFVGRSATMIRTPL